MMMTAMAALLLVLSTVGVSAAAAAQVPVQPLAATEVLLETSGIGSDIRPADRAIVKVMVVGRGSDLATAQREHDAVLRRVTDAAAAAGVPPSSISREATGSSLEVFDVEELPPSAEQSGQLPRSDTQRVGSTVTIRLPDARRAAGLVGAIEAAQARVVGQPEYELADDSAARRAARIAAIAKARADAETYAGALNMRVVRIVRVTERSQNDFFSVMFGEMMRSGGRRDLEGMAGAGEIATHAIVGVDFALAPR